MMKNIRRNPECCPPPPPSHTCRRGEVTTRLRLRCHRRPRSGLAPAVGAGNLHPHYTSATLITTCSRAVILHLTVTMTAPPLRGLAAFLYGGATQHCVVNKGGPAGRRMRHVRRSKPKTCDLLEANICLELTFLFSFFFFYGGEINPAFLPSFFFFFDDDGEDALMYSNRR